MTSRAADLKSTLRAARIPCASARCERTPRTLRALLPWAGSCPCGLGELSAAVSGAAARARTYVWPRQWRRSAPRGGERASHARALALTSTSSPLRRARGLGPTSGRTSARALMRSAGKCGAPASRFEAGSSVRVASTTFGPPFHTGAVAGTPREDAPAIGLASLRASVGWCSRARGTRQQTWLVAGAWTP
jgi:hypothetical protein